VGSLGKFTEPFASWRSNGAKNCNSWQKILQRIFIPEGGREGFFQKKRCHSRLSLKTAQSSAEVMAVVKDCQQRLL